jgi:ferrous iron transport protein B
LGVVAALVSAFVFKKLLKTEEHSFLLMELPSYQLPQLKNVGITVLEKVKSFVLDAGKIILLVSIVLWFLASYGPEKDRAIAAAKAIEMAEKHPETSLEKWQASYALESSYAGMMGKWIEPVIAPLGYDWKIGIALISSFAAREVFVGTMATIYAIEGADSDEKLAEKMQNAVDPETNLKVFTMPTSLSLMVFYLFAMQCMSTLAVVKRETKSWKWPAIQLIYLTVLAYVASFVVYRIFL